MISYQHKQIIKSWVGLNEVDVIKKVIEDGKHIELCINYWSRKRRISAKQYEIFFRDVVLSHINHLLNQYLFIEAEKILINLKYDMRYAFYQFAAECNDKKIHDMTLKYLQERDPDHYTELINTFQHNWSILQCLKKHESFIEDLGNYMQHTDFITFMNLEDNIKQLLLIKIFFKTRRSAVLQYIQKYDFWEFLIRNQKIHEIIRWCYYQSIESNQKISQISSTDDLLIQYNKWKITNEMYQNALKIFENIENDVLRDVFAASGYFFSNESKQLHLYRICLTESFPCNNLYINNLNLGEWILQNQWYYLLLCDATYKEEYNRLAAKLSDDNSIINLISTLRNANIKHFNGFEQMSIKSRKCLQQMNFHSKQHILFQYWQALTMQISIADIINTSATQTVTSTPTSLSINQDTFKLPFEAYRNKREKFEKLNNFNDLYVYDLLKAINIQFNLKELHRIGENFIGSYLNDIPAITTKCLHYVKQMRSAFAAYSWFTGHLTQYRQIATIRYYAISQNIYNLALELPLDAKELLCHCIAFCEMLGFSTQSFRCFLHALHSLDRNNLKHLDSMSFSKVPFLLANQIISCLNDQNKSFPFIKFKALLSINHDINNDLKVVFEILNCYTKNNDYWSFLVLLQYCDNFTLKHMQVLIKSFPNATIRNHLVYAILFKLINNLTNFNHQYHHHRHRKTNRQITKSRNRHNKQHNVAACCDGAFTYSSFICKQRILACSIDSSVSCCQTMRHIPDLLAHIISLTSTHRISYAATEDATLTSEQFANIMQKIPSKKEEICKYCNYRHIENIMLDASYSAVHDRLSILVILATAINVTEVKSFSTEVNLAWCWLTWLTVITNYCWHSITLNIDNNFFWQLIEIIIQMKQLKHLIRSFLIFYPTSGLLHLFRFLQLTLEIDENNETTAAAADDDDAIHTLKLYYLDVIKDNVQIPFASTFQYNSMENTVSKPYENRSILWYSIRVLLHHLQMNFPLPAQRQTYLKCICSTGFTNHKDIFDLNLLKDFHKTIVAATNLNGDVIDFNQLMKSADPQKYYHNVIKDILASKHYNLAVNLLLLLNKPIDDIIYSKWMYQFNEILSLGAISSTASTASTSPTSTCKTMIVTNGKIEGKNYDQHYQKLFEMFEKCEYESLHHSLPPEMFANFLICIANKLSTDNHRIRYLIFYKTLNFLKHQHHHHHQLFSYDQIEFDMIMCYLKIDTDNLPLYHSKYFEKSSMNGERGILYKSLVELKEMNVMTTRHNIIADAINSYQFKIMKDKEAKRLEVLLNQLLDDGDIVQVLRLEQLFQSTTMDVRWIICSMGMAEKLISIPSNRLNNEKQFLNDINNYAHLLINQQPPYTLDTFNANDYIDIHVDADTNAHPIMQSNHRQDILRILQHIQNNKIKHGLQLMNRIVSAYRIAIFLNKDYIDILHTKDIQILLKNLNIESSSQHLLIMRDILTSSYMSCEELSKLIAYEILAVIIRSQFHNFNHSPFGDLTDRSNPKIVKRNIYLWGYNIDVNMQLFLQIVPDPTKLGIYILKYCDALKIYRRHQNNQKCDNNNSFFKDVITILNGSSQTASHQVLSHRKQMFTYVELLIKAHHCFVHECSMEGIANVLHRTKNLNAILIQTKSWSLIIRMLIGIGRYQDMSYCFQSLIENEQFESLLGQFEEDKTIGLRQAILAYLRSGCHKPQQSKELFQLAALHFLMYKDLAEMWQCDAEQLVQQIYETASVELADSYNSDNSSNSDLRTLQINPTILKLLHQALDYYIHAAENYLLDNKIHLAGKNSSQAELIALQIDLANKAGESSSCSDETNQECICILKLQLPTTIQHLVNNKLSVYQSTVVCRVYNYNVSWSEALLYQFVIRLQDSYLNEFLQIVDLNDLMLANVVKSFQHYSIQHQVNKEMEERLAKLITFVKSVTLKYKLASILSLKSMVLSLINNNNSIYFLRDMNFNTKANKTI